MDSSFSEHGLSAVTMPQSNAGSFVDGTGPKKKKKSKKVRKEDEDGSLMHSLPDANLSQLSYHADSASLVNAKKRKKNKKKKKKENDKTRALDHSKLEDDYTVDSDESLEISFKSDYSSRKKMDQVTYISGWDKSGTSGSSEWQSLKMKEYDWPSHSDSTVDLSPKKRKKHKKVSVGIGSAIPDSDDLHPNKTQELEDEVSPRKKQRLDKGISTPNKTPQRTPKKSKSDVDAKKKKKKVKRLVSSNEDIISDFENSGECDPFNTKVSSEISRSTEKSKEGRKKVVKVKQDEEIGSNEESESDDEEVMAECISKIKAYGDRLGSTKTDILVSDAVSKIIHTVNSIRGDLGPTLLKELKEKGYEMRTCRYTCMEDVILKRNWKQFLEEHPIDNPLLLFEIPHDEELKRLVAKYDFFISLSRNLNRTVRSCFLRAKVLLYNKKSKTENQVEDWEKVEELFQKHGKKWKLISRGSGVNYEAIRSVYRTKKRTYHTGPWTSAEEDALWEAVEEAKSELDINDDFCDENLPWTQIASKVCTRGEYQCRRHWLFAASWKNSKEEKDCKNGSSRTMYYYFSWLEKVMSKRKIRSHGNT